MSNRNVNLELFDKKTRKTDYRTIDITNAMYSGSEGWELGTVESQRIQLESWIQDRGNPQAEADYQLISWTLS